MPATIPRGMENSLHKTTDSAREQKKTGHTRPRRPDISLDQQGRLRVANLLAILNISHSTLYAGVKNGRYPVPDGRDGIIPFWNTATIKRYLEVGQQNAIVAVDIIKSGTRHD